MILALTGWTTTDKEQDEVIELEFRQRLAASINVQGYNSQIDNLIEAGQAFNAMYLAFLEEKGVGPYQDPATARPATAEERAGAKVKLREGYVAAKEDLGLEEQGVTDDPAVINTAERAIAQLDSPQLPSILLPGEFFSYLRALKEVHYAPD